MTRQRGSEHLSGKPFGDAMQLEEFLKICRSIKPNKRGCKIWTGVITAKRYPGPRIGNEQKRGNRVVLSAKLGRPIRPGFCACHECDTPLCVNEDHLYEGTHQDNMKDAFYRGRVARGERSGARRHPEKVPRGDAHYSKIHPEKVARGDKHGSRTHPEKWARGERVGSAKLTEPQVLDIRRKHSEELSICALGREYRMSAMSIWDVVHRKTWKHIEEVE